MVVPEISSNAPDVGTTRLHITPLTRPLLSAIVPSSLLPRAENVSYHSVQTFPEKSYGFVDLPAMEAKAVRNKMNGATLKGQKIRIEEAKPEKRKWAEEEFSERTKNVRDAQRDTSRDGAHSTITSRPKGKGGVLPGYQLPDERHVRRGWTEPAHESKRRKDQKEGRRKAHVSKYTKQPELLFRTKLPASQALPSSTADGKTKPRGDNSGVLTVHEFEKTKKQASFLRDQQSSASNGKTAEYVDGKGWVDEHGVLIEQEAEALRRKNTLKSEGSEPEVRTVTEQVNAEAESRPTSGSSSPLEPKLAANRLNGPRNEDQENSRDYEATTALGNQDSIRSTSPKRNGATDVEELSESSSETSQVSDSDEEEDESSTLSVASLTDPPLPIVVINEHDPSESPAADAQKSVHPLEALYKRPGSDKASSLAPIKTSFSFFDTDDVDGGEENLTHMHPPLTPFTRQDRHTRIIRSAAPTPDTALPGKKFSLAWSDGQSDDDQEDEEEFQGNGAAPDDKEGESGSNARDATTAHKGSPPVGLGIDETKPESEFATWFWENMGELNRAWKKRRREALRQQRQTENKRLGRRVF